MSACDRELWPGLEATARWLAANGRNAEENGNGLGPEMSRLHEDGLLFGCVPSEFGGAGLGQECSGASTTFEILRRLGRASLPVARLFEGHINAVKLISLYGCEELKTKLFNVVSRGEVLGVWGADGSRPVTFALQSDDSVILKGSKNFASGLGCVTHAVVTAKPASDGAAASLFVVEVSDRRRQDASAWAAAGMKATLSGQFNFDGMCVAPSSMLGRSGDYEREPHFDGGVWRYCAAHIGGVEGLIDYSLATLATRNHLEDPFQLARMGRAIGSCRAAAALVREWSVRIECAEVSRRDSPEEAMAGALLARTFVANMAIDALQDCERSLGTSAHMTDGVVERLRRDLSLYIRQASPDAKLIKATRTLCPSNGQALSLW